MKINQLIDKLNNIKDIYGECDIYLWDNHTMSHYQLMEVLHITDNNFCKNLHNDENYIEDFNKINNNIVLL